MRNAYVEDAVAAVFFRVLCNAPNDIFVKEQMSIVLRFVKSKAVYEVLRDLKIPTLSQGKELLRNCLKLCRPLDYISKRHDRCASMKG